MTDKPVYKFSTKPTADTRGTERREDHREDRREDHRAERREDRREDNREDRREARFDNPTQDPNHPANRTLSPEHARTPRPEAEGYTSPVGVEDTMTEQEKDAASGGAATRDNIPGVGPATATPEVEPAETIEEQGIGPRTPYPTGDPAPPDESVTRFQGIKTNKPAHNEPNKPLSTPAGTAREHR